MSDDEIDLNLVGGEPEKAATYLNPRSAQINEYLTFIQNHLLVEQTDTDSLKIVRNF